MACNIGEIVTLFLATLLNFHQPPLVAVQLLWLNLVMWKTLLKVYFPIKMPVYNFVEKIKINPHY